MTDSIALAQACAEIQQRCDAWVCIAISDRLHSTPISQQALFTAKAACTQAITALVERAEKAEGENKRLVDAERVVAEQAKDPGLWFKPVYITEAALQHELRRLHMAVEGKSAEECAIGLIRRAALTVQPSREE